MAFNSSSCRLPTLHAASAVLVNNSSFRLLHTSPAVWNRNSGSASDLPSSSTDGSSSDKVEDVVTREKRIAAQQARAWLCGSGVKFRDPKAGGGVNYIGGGNKPFPLNPYFIPLAPISEKIRSAIFAKFEKNPSVQTPLKLAKDYKLSLARIQAILRLKALEKKMKESGQQIQENLTYNMEKMLICPTLSPIVEPVHIIQAEQTKPLFQFIEEEDTLSPEDAARLLKQEPFSNIEIRLNKAAERVFELDAPTAPVTSPSPIAEKPALGGKFSFAFIDTSKDSKKEMFMRDNKGVFRKASRLEKFYKRAQQPKFFF